MAATDQALVRAALAGESEAFGQLVERYARLVHGVILHKVRRADEVEDLVQDVFCRAYQELASLRHPDKFAPWLARMASNRAQAWLRQRRVRQAQQQCGDFARWHPDAPTPEGQLEARETCGIVWEALDRLAPEYRQVLLLYHFEGCAQQDIARFLGVALSTVKWRLLRARQSMRRKIEEVFCLEQHQVRLDERHLRQRVGAALPLLVQPARPRWGWAAHLRYGLARRALPLAYAGLMGLVGSLIYEVGAQQMVSPRPLEARGSGAIFVRLGGGEALGRGQTRPHLPCAAADWAAARPDSALR